MHIAYLASAGTHPSSPERRSDAFEHDRMMELLRRAASLRGWTVDDPVWNAPDLDASRYDHVLIGTTWDYAEQPEAFLATLRAIESVTALHNPVDLVRWNADKRYLADLEAAGVPSIPTVWLDHPTDDALRAAFDHLGSDDLVVKQRIGAGAIGQHRVTRGGPLPVLPVPVLVQGFLPSIQTEGEQTFVFVDGELSHALTKRPASGDYRVQSMYGGHETVLAPSTDDLSAARAVLEALDTVPLYARVDMVRVDGTLRLMELELVEPYLYPEQGPELGDRLLEALARR